MKAFIFYAEAGLTKEYHSGGGGIVIAEDKDQAVESVEAVTRGSKGALEDLVVAEITLSNGNVFIFQDTGCC